jgi:hypothetical protein
MGFAAAAMALGAAGSIGSSMMGASAAKDQAEAIQKAVKRNNRSERRFAERWETNIEDLVSDKDAKLKDLGNIFDRFESTGAFGDTRTQENLRRAQQDFSALAAGDFTAFESQLRKNLGDALVSTVGSGAPVGTFAQLGADTQMQMRREGVQTAASLSEFFAGQAQNLLGLEFGIMDQSFDVRYQLDRNRQNKLQENRMIKAGTAGASKMADASILGNVGNQLTNLGGFMYANNLQQQGIDLRRAEIEKLGETMGSANSMGMSFDRFMSGAFTPLNQMNMGSGGGGSAKGGMSFVPEPMYPMGQAPWDSSAGVLPSIDGVSGPRNSSLFELIRTGRDVISAL